MDENPTEPGGFFPPSPSPSNLSTSSIASNLPHPRAHPLRPGSAKEDAARRYVEGRMLNVTRRYAKKFQPKEKGDDVRGYESMSEVTKDLGEVVDVVWLSGTPGLQIPYLLGIAGSLNNYLPAFSPSPKATFALLRKLDHAFSSLMQGEDNVTGEILPGFQGGMRAGMSKTDMVRCKGLVEATRVLMVDIMNKEPDLQRDVEESDAEIDVDMDSTWDREGEKYEMDVARVYEQTIIQLGTLLEDSGVFQGVSVESG